MLLLSGPNICGNENKYVKDCLDTGWVSSIGSYVNKFEDQISSFTGSKNAIATSSGTTALHISLILSNVHIDDYVIVPNLTFVASVNSIKYTGANPILIDVCPHTWQMDLDLLENFLKKNTIFRDNRCVLKSNNRKIKAIMPVHVFGNMCDMQRLVKISNDFNLIIIEDSTEALGSKYKDKYAGTFGAFGCYSFNGNKLITTGAGGMIVTDNDELAAKAKHLTTQAKTQNFEYFHDMIGYNYRLNNVSAAIGVAQMENLENFINKKKFINKYYRKSLEEIPDIIFQKIPNEVNPNYWLFTIKSNYQKDLLDSLNRNKLQSRPLWVPMNILPMYSNDIFVSNDNITGQLYKECLSIPCSTDIKESELKKVVSTIKKVYN